MNLKKKRHLFRDSAKWRLLSYYIFFLMRLFYRKITVEGKENIPPKGPIIFAPNHQNALMDPLAILYAARRQTVFLARADIFKIPILRNLFFWLKIIPIFRIRDGKENLGNNEASFNVAVEVLENNRSVCIFPEAAHTNQRSLLPLKKGVPRLAFLAEEKNNFKLGVKVIPVGIYFDDYEHMRSSLHVRFGQPLDVGRFEDAYEKNPQRAMHVFRNNLTEKLSDIALDIKVKEYYDVFYTVSEIFAEPLEKEAHRILSGQVQRFAWQKKMVAALEAKLSEDPDFMSQFRSKVLLFLRLLKTNKIKWEFLKLPVPVFSRLWLDGFLLLITLPVFIYGLVNNILFYGSVKMLVQKIKDHQFHSSIKFVWGLAASPLFYLLQSVLFFALSGNLPLSLAYLVSLPFSGFLARIWIAKFRKTWQYGRLYFLKRANGSAFKQLESAWFSIFDDLKLIVKK